jgi:MFS family permease
MLTTSSNTLVIDIMPSSRRGEGLGYYGIMGNIAMATGPMTGLFLYHSTSFEWIFIAAIIAGVLGSFFAIAIKVSKKQITENKIISLERFILLKGIPAAICFMLIAMPYSITTSYITLYLKENGFSINTGLFFTFMAAGMILSRLSSGKQVDKGLIVQSITRGMILATLGFLGEVFLIQTLSANLFIGRIFFYLIATAIGYGFGTFLPAFNTLFLNLAPHTRRATANATYLTGWDVGIGLGVYFGGIISDSISFRAAYSVGFMLFSTALILFILVIIPHFEKNRLQ